MSHLASYGDAMREFATNVGGEVPDEAWLLTDYDAWVRNPHYRGPPQPHPESVADDDAQETENERWFRSLEDY